MVQRKSAISLRDMALTPAKAYRTENDIPVPEWDGMKVSLREPSASAWLKFREIITPDVVEEGDTQQSLTPTQTFLRNRSADVVLFVDVLLDESGERVFSDDDIPVVTEIYGAVHARLLARAIALGMSQEEAGKPSGSR